MHRKDEFLRLALANPANAAVIERLAAMDVPDAWLVSGSLFQSVWNGLTGRDPAHGIADYDVFYFDPDSSWEAEDAVIRRAASVFADLGVEVQLRNQARVHLWYPEKHGRPYPRMRGATQSLGHFLAPCCAVAIRKRAGVYELEAPFGLDDLFAMVVRPNLAVGGPAAQYDAKAARWKSCWPELQVLPWSD